MHMLINPGITEGKAADAIFDACRANEAREDKGGVKFNLMTDGNYAAVLRDDAGVILAVAVVDKFDC